MTAGERIKKIREGKGLSQVEFAKPLGKTSQYISLLEKNKNLPSATLVSLILTYYGVSQQWWATGEGEMFEVQRQPSVNNLPWDEKLFLEYYRSLTPAEKAEWMSRMLEHKRDRTEKE